MKLHTIAVTALLVSMVHIGLAQAYNPNSSDGFSISRRRSSNRSSQNSNTGSPNTINTTSRSGRTSRFGNSNNTNTKATPTPAAKATPATSGSSSRSTSRRSTSSSSRSTTSSASRGAIAKKPGAPGATANSAGWSGHVNEVSKSFVEAMKTQKVDFDEAEMRKKPSIIMLNSRKYNPEADRDSQANSKPSGLIARPL